MRSYDKPVSSELREKLIIGAAAAIMRIYRYFQERRFAATYATGNSTTYQSVTTKVGRTLQFKVDSGRTGLMISKQFCKPCLSPTMIVQSRCSTKFAVL
jgi:hypothetical protein